MAFRLVARYYPATGSRPKSCQCEGRPVFTRQMMNIGRRVITLTCCGLLTLMVFATGCAVEAEEPEEIDPGVAALIETLLHDEDPSERRFAAVSLGQRGEASAVPALLQALREDEDRGVRTQAVLALGLIGDPEAMDDLVKALEDEHEDMRRQAARALGEMGNEEALQPLYSSLRGDTSPFVRNSAAWALGEIGSADAVEVLVESLETDSSSHVRHGVVAALGEIGAQEAIEPLIGVLQKTDARLRWEAVRALSGMGQAAMQPLMLTLHEGPGDSPWFAAFALEKIGVPEAMEEIDRFLLERNIDLREVRENYRAQWPYEVMVLVLERYGTREMAEYYMGLSVDAFDNADQWFIVTEAARAWIRVHS